MLEGRVPTLVQLCQRVAAVHVDYISGLGDELSYDLVKPILERCTVDQLLRLEQASPHLERDTPEIWKQLCFRTYPTAVERYNRGQLPEPVSWREQYFSLVKEEARRIEEAGNKLRRQRQEADDRRKEQEVKFTAQVPQGKRRCRAHFPAFELLISHPGGVAAPPKTLFQKTKSDASRLKNIYSKPLLPPMPASGKSYRVLAPDDSVLFPSPSASSRVAVTTVIPQSPYPHGQDNKGSPDHLQICRIDFTVPHCFFASPE
ncbi:RNA polymerase II transcription factor SIII subunit A-domain-containing protein [Mycena amicta]|nr:RNA polymerase II transcription factor SIII subunit A-domain-containing protein [Mycena amicta]